MSNRQKQKKDNVANAHQEIEDDVQQVVTQGERDESGDDDEHGRLQCVDELDDEGYFKSRHIATLQAGLRSGLAGVRV
jgi:DNA-directed RNA polymerase specialized sigma54-like protein